VGQGNVYSYFYYLDIRYGRNSVCTEGEMWMLSVHDRLYLTPNDPEKLIPLILKNLQTVELNYQTIDRLFTIETQQGETLNVTDLTVVEEDGLVKEVKIEVES